MELFKTQQRGLYAALHILIHRYFDFNALSEKLILSTQGNISYHITGMWTLAIQYLIEQVTNVSVDISASVTISGLHKVGIVSALCWKKKTVGCNVI